MKVFVDTSVMFPLVSEGDPEHDRAGRIVRAVAETPHEFVSTNYVVVECLSLLQRRQGMAAAARFLDYVKAHVTVVWMDDARHAEALRAWGRAGQRDLSIVDCSSFLVMREQGIHAALAFDRHFLAAGFHLPGESPGPQVREPRTRYRASRRKSP